MNRQRTVWPLYLMMSGFAVYWCVLSVNPVSRYDWWLENVLVVLTLLAIVFTYRKFRFSNTSYLLILLFLALHTYGAHYSYHANPVDNWLQGIFGFERNHYDRIVHFGYGLLLAYPIWEFATRLNIFNGRWSYWGTPVIVLAGGALYEIFEMWVTFVVAPEIGVLFLGMQGDVWDTQHDMELALYGSLIAMTIARTAAVRAEPGKNAP